MAQTPPKILSFIGFNPTGDFAAWTIYTSRRRGVVWFSKSPPKKAPSYKQVHQRDRFRAVASLWRRLLPTERQKWARACARAHLSLSGYCLYVFWQTKRDILTIRTIERLAHVTLVE